MGALEVLLCRLMSPKGQLGLRNLDRRELTRSLRKGPMEGRLSFYKYLLINDHGAVSDRMPENQKSGDVLCPT